MDLRKSPKLPLNNGSLLIWERQLHLIILEKCLMCFMMSRTEYTIILLLLQQKPEEERKTIGFRGEEVTEGEEESVANLLKHVLLLLWNLFISWL